jgi:peptidoglycan-associated lipoprotein
MDGKENMMNVFCRRTDEPRGRRLVSTAALLLTTLVLSACVVVSQYRWVEVPGPKRPPAVVAAVEEPAPPPPVVVAPDPDLATWAGDLIYFDTDKSVLRPDAIATLDRQVEWLNRHPDVRVRLEGNTDDRGSIDYNNALGKRRAEAARDYLIAHGVAAPRITYASYGEMRPVAAGATKEDLARNRNVRVIVEM